MSLTTNEALIAYAEMINTLNSDNFIKLLADDFVLNSQWVFEDITNKQTYIDYINAKFETVRTTQSVPAAELGKIDAYGHTECVVLAQPTRDDLTATVFIDVADGKITQISMCAVPSPYLVERTGIYPIPDDYMEVMDLRGTTLEQIVYVDRNIFYKTFARAIKSDKELADSIAKLSLKLANDSEYFDRAYVQAISNEALVALIRTLMTLDKSVFNNTLKSKQVAIALLAHLKEKNFIHYESIADWVQWKLEDLEKPRDVKGDVLLVNTAIAKLVAITEEGYYDELIALIKIDSNFRDTLLEIEKQINWNYAYTTGSFNEKFLFLLNDFELDALIRAFTVLDGTVDKFTFGAVTPVPCLFHRLSEIQYSKFNELTDWVLKNRTNLHLLPFGWNEQNEAKSLREYLLLEEHKRLKGEAERVQNNLRSVQKKLANPNKATDDLKDAIKRKDWQSFNKLISNGADIYAKYEDSKTLAEKIKEIKGIN